MVDACLANGDLDGAVAVFRDMKQALPDFSRGAVVFSALVKACVKRKLTKPATEVYDEIKDVCTCSKVTYNTLIGTGKHKSKPESRLISIITSAMFFVAPHCWIWNGGIRTFSVSVHRCDPINVMIASARIFFEC